MIRQLFAALAVLYLPFLSSFQLTLQKPTRPEAPWFPGAALWIQTKEGAICSGLACGRLWSRQSSGSRVWASLGKSCGPTSFSGNSAFSRAGSLQAMISATTVEGGKILQRLMYEHACQSANSGYKAVRRPQQSGPQAPAFLWKSFQKPSCGKFVFSWWKS